MSTRRRFGPIHLILLAAAFSLTACDIVVESLNAKATDEWKKTYQLAPGGQVEVVNMNGSIQVEPSDGNTVEVTAEKIARGMNDEAAKETLKNIEIREEVTPDRVRLQTAIPSGGGNFSHREVNYRLTVPRQASVRLRTSNGTVRAAGIRGDARLETTNGSIHATGLGGSIEGGTTNGSVTIEVDSLGKDGIRLETTNGSIALTMPSAAKADIAARCVNGSVRATNLNVVSQGSGETSRRRLEGPVNGGGPKITLETTNGSVRLTGK